MSATLKDAFERFLVGMSAGAVLSGNWYGAITLGVLCAVLASDSVAL